MGLTALLSAVLMVAGLLTAWPRATRQVAHAEEPSKLVKVDLNVQEKTINVLGVPQTVWTYNGTIPGPTIRVHYGDTLQVTLHNTHNLPHTLHTHFMDYDISSDGSSATASLPIVPHQNDDVVAAVGGIVPGVANKPGPKVGVNPIGPYDPREDEDYARPGESRTYTWKMDDVGTIWYHCHVMEATNHISKGLFGAIIVYPKGWTWQEDPPDPLNGNLKANLTNAKGEHLREDIVIMSEKNHADDSLVGLVANGGAAGGVELANYRGWNDPYLIGPFNPGEKGLIHVMNIGETGKSWHLHGHHWYRLQQIWHPWQGYPEWHQTNTKDPDPSGSFGPPFDPNPFTPAMELSHTRWISPGEIMPIFIRAGKPGMWFGHDHVVPQAYLGMVPWLVVKAPGGTPAGAKQQQVLDQMNAEHLRLVHDPNAKATTVMPGMPNMPMPGIEGMSHPTSNSAHQH
jgi:FtsP/CotA-like multicopper oxidase with cupredoxin domain